MTTVDRGRVINGAATNIRDHTTEPPHYRAIRGGPKTSRFLAVFGLILMAALLAGLLLNLYATR